MTVACSSVKVGLLDAVEIENGELLRQLKVQLEMVSREKTALYHRGLDAFQIRLIATITTCNSRAENESPPAFSIP